MVYKKSSTFWVGHRELFVRGLLDFSYMWISVLNVRPAFEPYPISRPTKERTHHGT